jgi:hypothetical protein
VNTAPLVIFGPMLLIFSSQRSPRLDYIADFLGMELFGEPIEVTSDVSRFLSYEGPKLNYSSERIAEGELIIRPVSLLFEKDIRPQDISCFEWKGFKAFFRTDGDLPFDLPAAVFYLITRFEEFLPHEKDAFGRYDHKQSLASREGFLHLPLVNIWIDAFKDLLSAQWPSLTFRHRHFKALLTYDIDMAYAFKHKPWWLHWGGWLKCVMKGQWKEAALRARVRQGRERDPNDCYEWLDALHLYCRVKPVFFFLVAAKRGQYDKNISTSVVPFRELIEYYAASCKVGLHPSWQSGDVSGLIREEAEWLEVIADRPVVESRQHYVRFTLPATYRELLAAGIRRDHSMGYGTINGFRASIASSYYWYDLERDEKTSLEIYPFSFMDANAFFEQHLTPGQAYNELMAHYRIVKKYSGLFISVWHNYLLGTHPRFKGWREMFELFMKETVYWDAYNGAD